MEYLVRFALKDWIHREDAMEKLDEYLTVSDAAAFLGVSSNTVRNWERSGKIPVHRHPINGYRLFRQSDLEAVLLKAANKESERRKRNAK